MKNSKIARWLRKWADLLDPKTDPSDGISIRVDVDTREAEAHIKTLIESLERLNSLIPESMPIPIGNGMHYMKVSKHEGG